MTIITVNKRNEIPQNAKIGQIFKVVDEFWKWEICRNWCGTVFATQINSVNEVVDNGDEVVLRQDW